MDDVTARMGQSTSDFVRLVWPVFQPYRGDLAPVESVTANDFAVELDRRSGIDHWILRKDGHISGLASRVQWCDRSYDTFTIRIRSRHGRATEYHKRKAELFDTPGRMISPWYICHAFVSEDRTRLIAAAFGRMIDAIAAVDLDLGWMMPPNRDGTQGYAVKWDVLRQHGAPIDIYRSNISRRTA